MTTICIHVGIHKTGTSSFQEYLNGKSDILKKHKILYPLSGRSYAESLHPNHSDFAISLLHKQDKPQEAEQLIKLFSSNLSEEIATEKYDLAIISSEVFTQVEHKNTIIFSRFVEAMQLLACEVFIHFATRELRSKAISDLTHQMRVGDLNSLFNPELQYKQIKKNTVEQINRWRNYASCKTVESSFEEAKHSKNLPLFYLTDIISKANVVTGGDCLGLLNSFDESEIRTNSAPLNTKKIAHLILLSSQMNKYLSRKIRLQKQGRIGSEAWEFMASGLNSLSADSFTGFEKLLENPQEISTSRRSRLMKSVLQMSEDELQSIVSHLSDNKEEG